MEVGNRVVLLTMLVGLLASCATAQQSAIAGRVQDSEGAAIASARIVVHWDSNGAGTTFLTNNVGEPVDVKTLSDTNGHFSISVSPGFYDVFITAKGWSPMAEKVRVKSDAPTELKVKLHAYTQGQQRAD